MYADTLPFIDKTSVISTSSHGSLLLFFIYYFFSESQRCWSQTKLVIRASADDFASNRIVESDIIEEMYSTINQTLFGDRLSIIDYIIPITRVNGPNVIASFINSRQLFSKNKHFPVLM